MLSAPIFILILIIVARALYNYKCATFEGLAFSITIIVLDIAASILANPFLIKHILTSEAYQPLFVVGCFVVTGYWLYRFLISEFFYTHVIACNKDFELLGKEYLHILVIFCEMIATILAYNILSQLPDINSQLLLQAVSNPSVGVFGKYCLILTLIFRIGYNFLFGHYKTLTFWFLFIISLVVLSIFGSRPNFANNVIMFIILVQLVFRYIATETNFYRLIAACRTTEARFAIITHLLTAALELVGCLMVIFIFVNSYAMLRSIPGFSA